MRPPRAYVAGAWGNRQRLREFMTEMRLMGFVIAHDWTEAAFDEDMVGDRFERISVRDVQAVQSCDLLVLINDDCNMIYRGSWVEYGAALGLGIPVVTLLDKHGHQQRCVFVHHPLTRIVDSYKNLREWLHGWMRGWVEDQ